MIIQRFARGYVARRIINGIGEEIHRQVRLSVNIVTRRLGPWTDPVARLWVPFPDLALALFLYQALMRAVTYCLLRVAATHRWVLNPAVRIQRAYIALRFKRLQKQRVLFIRTTLASMVGLAMDIRALRAIVTYLERTGKSFKPIERIQSAWRGLLSRRLLAAGRWSRTLFLHACVASISAFMWAGIYRRDPVILIQSVWRGRRARLFVWQHRCCQCPCAARNGHACSNILPVGVDSLTSLCRPHQRLPDGTCNCPCLACNPELHGDTPWRLLEHDAGDDDLPDADTIGRGKRRRSERIREVRVRRAGRGMGGSMLRTLTLFLGLFTLAESRDASLPIDELALAPSEALVPGYLSSMFSTAVRVSPPGVDGAALAVEEAGVAEHQMPAFLRDLALGLRGVHREVYFALRRYGLEPPLRSQLALWGDYLDYYKSVMGSLVAVMLVVPYLVRLALPLLLLSV